MLKLRSHKQKPRAAYWIPALALVPMATVIEARATDMTAEQAENISDKMLAALVETNGVPGMGAAVWRDGKVVWTGSAGYRDVEKGMLVDPDTIFRLASVSKLMAATAAARLKQDDALDVDRPVASTLSYLSAEWAPLTTRQLAAHISGLPHYQDVDENRGKIRYASIRDAVSIFKDRDLLFAPGTKYSYSSWGYTLLSAVVEQRARRPFLDYVATQVTPGLAIIPDATGSDNPSASKAYEFVNGQARPAPAHDYSYTWAGGGFGATPQSLVQFGGRVMSGKIVSPETFEWMLTPAMLADGSTVKDEDYEVGFGWRTGTDTDGDRIAHHAGVTIGARSALVLWPERSVAVSLLSNALWVSSIEQSAMMIAAPFKPEPAGLARTICPTRAARYDGRFGESRVAGAIRLVMEDGVCVGDIVPDKVLDEYFNAFPQKDATKIRLIGLDAKGGLSRAALVTPIGIYDLRAQTDGSHRARMGSTRALSLTFHLPETPAKPSADARAQTAQIREVIEAFRSSIINKDKVRFLGLFLHDKATWQSVKSDKTLLMQRQDNGGNAIKVAIDSSNNHISFIDGIVASPNRQEERFSNIKIDTDGDIASVVFDFTYHANDKIINRGKEAWHMVNTGNGWKIVSVIYSINRSEPKQ